MPDKSLAGCEITVTPKLKSHKSVSPLLILHIRDRLPHTKILLHFQHSIRLNYCQHPARVMTIYSRSTTEMEIVLLLTPTVSRVSGVRYNLYLSMFCQ